MSFRSTTTTKWAGDAYKKAFNTEMLDGYMKSAENIRDAARGRAPVKKGVLVTDIRAGKSEEKQAAFVFSGSRREDIIYPPFVEYGTANIRANPYMRRSMVSNIPSTLAEASRTGKAIVVKQRIFKTRTRTG